MNTKKKNKKPNKPNPTQKGETIASEKDEEVPKENPEILLKNNEERVPEITSEVSPVFETSATESDAPKKPKRNRGKKKRSDKGDIADEEQEAKPVELITGVVKPTTDVKDDKTIETPKETTDEVANVSPTDRKKKNKNKKTPEQLAEEQRIAEQELNILPMEERDVEISDVKIVTLVPVITETEQESKSAKKKNKKKKRNDSERSDKADETLLCTSAFQKLLEPRDENKEVNQEYKEKECLKSTTDSNKTEAIVKVVDTKQQCLLEKKIEEHEPAPVLISEETIKDDSGKSKKKNKKDKKHLSKPESEVTEEMQKPEGKITMITEQTPSLTLTNVLSMTEGIAFEQIAEKHTEKIIMELPVAEKEKSPKPVIKKDESSKPVVEKEKSPKPKAKIAKPVEKKRKEKSDSLNAETPTESTENISVTPIKEMLVPSEKSKSKVEENTMVSDTPKIKTPEPKEAKHMEILETTKLEEPTTKQPAPPITSIVAFQTDTIPVPHGAMGKKRNKSPHRPKRASKTPEPATTKPTEAIPLPFEHLVPHRDVSELPFEVKSETLDSKKRQDLTKQDKEFVYKTEELTENIPFGIPVPDIPVEKTVPQLTEEKVQVKRQGEPTTAEVPKVEHMQLPEAGIGKKKKKSPKMPRKFLATPEVGETTEKDAPFPIFKDPLEMKQENKEKTETPPELPPLEDIEIRSIKAEESEGSSCDIVPDVHYPRAASQHYDGNNNTVIREVTERDAKLNIPIVIPGAPFIQSSGETPTPEIFQTGIRVTEIDATLNKPEEKTDLKSKVMEVNQDMEELRLSIERSLAELTSMEKGERETEKQFEKAHAKLEHIKDMAYKLVTSDEKEKQSITPICQKVEEPKIESKQTEIKEFIKPPIEEQKITETPATVNTPPPPICPARKDNKGKGKSKKKGKQEAEQTSTTSTTTTSESTRTESKDTSQETKKEEKTEQKSNATQEKGKQQSGSFECDTATATQDESTTEQTFAEFVPIENFEDAMTSSLDDVNKSFEMIANEDNKTIESQNNPEISVTAPIEDDEKHDKQHKDNPVSPPKNLLGHPNIPVRLNKTDYKKEKNKTPNTMQAKVKIKDDVPIEINKESKESQTENKRFLKDRKSMNATETISSMTNENEEYIYKYSFRKVYLPNACHVCKKDLKQARVPCSFCNLIFYCNQKHKDEDYGQHQALCFAVSTIVHLKDQKHIYADSKDVTGHNYRLLRMQMIVSCEKVLKRKLLPWEQEALLYPRMCGDVSCREWRQGKLKDCEGCGQITYCSENSDHLPKSHQRWCKSYSLYQRLVCYQQTKGRLEPKLPSRVMLELYQIPEKMNEVLASMYEEKIDMNDIQYAALTQIATAPLTAAYCQQLYSNKMNSTYANGVHKKSTFIIHVVGAELQFEADALNKWEVFFLHLRPDVKDLRVVLIGPELNPSNLPLDLLGKIKLCENCRQNKRRVVFDFQDKKTYSEYWSTDYIIPDLVCTFNPSIQRSSIYNGKDTWPSTIKCILKLKVPFIVTSYTLNELQRDLERIKEFSEVDLNIISEPKLNTFASVRPDRNFISDDEIPLLFKNYCFMVVCGGF